MSPLPLETHTDRARPSLLLLLTAAVLVVTAVVAAFAYVAEWWLLPVAVFALLASTAIVVLAIGQVLGEADSGPAATPPLVRAEQPKVAPLAASEPVSLPAGARPVLGH